MSETAGHYDDTAEGREVALTDTSALVSSSEVAQQIATAKAYPRSLTAFRREAMEVVSITEDIAAQCIYVLPARGKGNKAIEGASARFAEIILSCWGNIRTSARVTHIGDDHLTAEGVCYDLQRNNAIKFEVMRRIVNRGGERFSPDMIGVTGNAASSIALRNAVLKVIPKAFWADIYEKARVVARGDDATLADRRLKCLKTFKDLTPSILPHQVYQLLGVQGIEDIGTDDLLYLGGVLNGIRDGDSSIDEIFGSSATVAPPRAAKANEFTRTAPATQAKAEPAAPGKQEAAKPAAAAPKEAAKPNPAPAPEPEPQSEPVQEAGVVQEAEAETEQQAEADPVAEFFDDLVKELETCTMVRQASALKAKASEHMPAPMLKKFSDLADVKIRDILNTTKPAPAKKK